MIRNIRLLFSLDLVMIAGLYTVRTPVALLGRSEVNIVASRKITKQMWVFVCDSLIPPVFYPIPFNVTSVS